MVRLQLATIGVALLCLLAGSSCVEAAYYGQRRLTEASGTGRELLGYYSHRRLTGYYGSRRLQQESGPMFVRPLFGEFSGTQSHASGLPLPHVFTRQLTYYGGSARKLSGYYGGSARRLTGYYGGSARRLTGYYGL